jgi:hypothetical protein
MVSRFELEIRTMRLAELLGPDEQVALVAVEVSPVSAEPLVRAVPEDWPELPAHSTS